MPTTTPPAKKSLKFLWIVIPGAILLLVASMFALFGLGRIVTNQMKTAGINDTAAIETAIKATSPNITSVLVDVSPDGLGHNLYVSVKLSVETITSTELRSILQVAYDSVKGKVQNIEIHAELAVDKEPIDLAPAAKSLGIKYTQTGVGYIFYSTNILKKELTE